MIRLSRVFTSVAASAALSAVLLAQQGQPAGIFTASTDIGSAQPGTTTFSPATGAYTVSGGGEDVWSKADDFRFTWVKFSGDAMLSADVHLIQPSTHAKAKGMLMFRQSLDPGSPYVDVALHGDGHIDLQWRAVPGGETKDVDIPANAATRLRMERKGDRFTAYVTSPATPAGQSSFTLSMPNTVYAGIGACSHSTSALQTVMFSDVKLDHMISAAQ